MNKKLDLLGKTFNRLTAIKETSERTHGKIIWECLCACGNKTKVASGKLKSGHTKSCGCLRDEVGRENLEVLLQKIRKPKGRAAFNTCYGRYKQSAEYRGKPFNLSKGEAEVLFKSHCYYCGSPPKTVVKNLRGNGDYIYTGIDRIDNSKGYTVDNCVPCCKYCNYSKGNRSKEEFILWVTKVYNHSKRKFT